VKWVPQGWPYINPVQDIQASKDAVRAGFSSRSRRSAARARTPRSSTPSRPPTTRAPTSKGRTVETIVDGLAAVGRVDRDDGRVEDLDRRQRPGHGPQPLDDRHGRREADMRKTADDLDTIRQTIVATYQWHVSELSADDIVALMDAETWMDADGRGRVRLRHRQGRGAEGGREHRPEGDRAAEGAGEVPRPRRSAARRVAGQPGPKAATASDILAACETAGLPVAFARELVTSAATLEQAQARIATEQTRIAAVAQRSTDIRNVCTMARQPELADSYIAGGMTVDAVRAQLAVITAKIDAAVNIDGAIDPTAAGNGKARIDHAAVYAEMNKFVTK
jgi:hypothetical protein